MSRDVWNKEDKVDMLDILDNVDRVHILDKLDNVNKVDNLDKLDNVDKVEMLYHILQLYILDWGMHWRLQVRICVWRQGQDKVDKVDILD